jgi:TolB protein
VTEGVAGAARGVLITVRRGEAIGIPRGVDDRVQQHSRQIFVANIDDLLAGTEKPRNITNSEAMIDDDPDWSPDGQSIAYTATRSPTTSCSRTRPRSTWPAPMGHPPTRVTSNNEEERGPSWSPDGMRIVSACRTGGGAADFEICTMNADGTDRQQLTESLVQDLTPTFSPDGQQIVFHRPVGGRFQLGTMSADRTSQTHLTNTVGLNLLANWGELRVKD